MDVASGLRPDPENRGWVLGWAVVRNSPWDLQGVYANEAEAKSIVVDHPGYEVWYGSHETGTDGFIKAN